MSNTHLLSVKDLKVCFPLKRSLKEIITNKPVSYVKAVDGVSFDIPKGGTLGLVGESGCGKSTIGKTLVRLIEPHAGSVHYNGKDIFKVNSLEAHQYCKKMQYIFQDPYSSLNPKMTVMELVRRPLEIFDLYTAGHERDKRVLQLLDMTGIAASQAERFPHEFSGGQRQRISIARTLAIEPEFVIADEPTSALDVSIQCQILDLLMQLRRELDLTMLFISHDLSVVNYITDNVLVMYLGHYIEKGNTKAVFKKPMHPYSKALLEALPKRASDVSNRTIKLRGYIPSPINPPQGCLLHPRCPFVKPECCEKRPELDAVGDRFVACHFAKSQNFEFNASLSDTPNEY